MSVAPQDNNNNNSYAPPPQNYQTYAPVSPVPGQAPPPTYEQFLSYQAPANYKQQIVYPVQFDASVIPKGNILTPFNAPPLDRLSAIPCRNDANGLECFDKALDTDPDELFRFFMTHLDAPKQHIEVICSHEETHRTSDGKTETRTVTDISFTVDISHLVSQGWSQIACVPEEGKASKSYRETLEEYCKSKNLLKEIHMKKQVIWDWEPISKQIEFIIRSSGYTHHISVKFPTPQNLVYVYSSSAISRASQDDCMRIICCITCLWIVFVPLYYLYRKKASNKIVVNYPLPMSPQDFFSRNYGMIEYHVRNRTITNLPIPAI